MTDEERVRLHREWLAWVQSNLGRNPARAEVAAAAAVDAVVGGSGYNAALQAAKLAWANAPLLETPTPGSSVPGAGQYSPDGEWWWNGQQWVPAAKAPPVQLLDAKPDVGSASGGIGGAGLSLCYFGPAGGALLLGWLPTVVFGDGFPQMLAGVAGNLAGALIVAMLVLKRLPDDSPLRPHAYKGLGFALFSTVVMAPIWLVRPFSGSATNASSGSIVSGGAVVWFIVAAIMAALLCAVLLTLRILSRGPHPFASPLFGALGSSLAQGRLVSIWLAVIVSGALSLSTLAAWLPVAQNLKDRRPGTTSAAQLQTDPRDYPIAMDACPVTEVARYFDSGVDVGSGNSSLRRSWAYLKANGAVEGATRLLVRPRGQCDAVVDSDPWSQSFVFRFRDADAAAAAYGHGVGGIVPAGPGRLGSHLGPSELGWEGDLNSSTVMSSMDADGSGYVAFWPYVNYLVFFLCRNVDKAAGWRPMPGDYYSPSPCEAAARAIQSRIHSAVSS